MKITPFERESNFRSFIVAVKAIPILCACVTVLLSVSIFAVEGVRIYEDAIYLLLFMIIITSFFLVGNGAIFFIRLSPPKHEVREFFVEKIRITKSFPKSYIFIAKVYLEGFSEPIDMCIDSRHISDIDGIKKVSVEGIYRHNRFNEIVINYCSNLL